MEIGMIGLGRMGANMTRRLLEGRHRVVVYDRSSDAVRATVDAGAIGAATTADLVRSLGAPRAIWVMVPAGAVDHVLGELMPLLSKGDTIVDGGNSLFHDDITRAAACRERGLHFVDCGTSGGTWGLERGYCLMIGGDRDAVDRLAPIFTTLSPGAEHSSGPARATGESTATHGYLHCGASGSGHFVKMVHNAIEYAMMAAYAEGFNVLAHANAGARDHVTDAETTPLRHPEHYRYEFDVAAIAELWRHGSVISSWLLDLTAGALARDPSLSNFEGRVSDSGEGRWTLAAATDLAVPVPALSSALFARFSSRGEDSYANRLLSAMRHDFGGHTEKKP